VNLSASWTIDFSNVSDPPDFYYFRVVKYWKGRRYVHHRKQESTYRKVVNSISKAILDEIDKEVLRELTSGNYAWD
jgi:hypothetical protein